MNFRKLKFSLPYVEREFLTGTKNNESDCLEQHFIN